MFEYWWMVGAEGSLLALESSEVIGLRLAKLMLGGPAALIEAQEMVTDKVFAAAEATMVVAAGGAPRQVVRGYRRRVAANRRRLSRN